MRIFFIKWCVAHVKLKVGKQKKWLKGLYPGLVEDPRNLTDYRIFLILTQLRITAAL